MAAFGQNRSKYKWSVKWAAWAWTVLLCLWGALGYTRSTLSTQLHHKYTPPLWVIYFDSSIFVISKTILSSTNWIQHMEADYSNHHWTYSKHSSSEINFLILRHIHLKRNITQQLKRIDLLLLGALWSGRKLGWWKNWVGGTFHFWELTNSFKNTFSSLSSSQQSCLDWWGIESWTSGLYWHISLTARPTYTGGLRLAVFI